uniref:Uncharacterized protein n=1 Tax=Sphaerodactylus townsendi TaxID=933632 RepID=A0ACB8FQ25_9SAUR
MILESITKFPFSFNSKEEILATADEDIWNNSRASESNIPKIRCLDVDDNEIKQSKENVKGKNVEDNEEDNEDNEKELELLLRHHFTRTRGSSRDENNAYISEPVKFPNDQQDLGEKVSSGLVRQPMPISCLTEHVLQERELKNIQFSTGYEYSQLLPEKSTVESVNNSAQFLESSITSETPLSQEFWPGTKEKEAAYSTDVIASKQVMNHTDVPKDETVSAPGSKTIERLFISEDNYDQHQEVWEGRLEMIPLNQSEQIQLKENVLGGQGDNMKPVHEQLVQKTSPQTSESSFKNIVIKEPTKETFENRTQPHLRRTYDNTLADVDIAITSLENAHSKDDDVEEKYKTEYNIDMGKEIKLSILEHLSEEEQMYPLTTNPADTKYHAEIQNQSWLSTTDSYELGLADELSQGEVVKPSSELSEVHAEAVYESTGFSWLNGNESSVRTKKGQGSSIVSKDFNRMNNQLSKDTNIIQFCPSNPNFVTTTDKEISIHSASINQEDVFDAGGNVEKGKHCQNYDPENISILEAEPCQNEPDRVITDDQGNRAGQGNCWSVLESQFAERESEANKRVQMKEQTGGEAMWGIRDNTRCLNVTPTDELFTCQDPVIYEGSSVAEYDSTGEAEAGTAAYVIKMTSESTPEKMSAGEKAVIVKLPQETALSDRPTEEKETVFDIHEGRNDGSHYPLCQCNTVGVLYDTKFEKESVSDIYNAHTHETAQEEIVSVPNASKKLAREENNSGNDLPFGEILWTYAAEGKPIRKQELSSEPSLNTSLYPQPGLHNEQAEEESVWGTFPDIGTKTEHNISFSDMNAVASSHENASTPVSEESMEINTVERGNAPHPYIESSINVSARLGCVFSPTNVVTDFSSNVSSEIELGDLPQSSALLLSGEEGAWNVGEFVHKPEHKLGKFLGPTILISEPTEEKEETNSESEGINEEKVLNLNNEGCDNQPVFDHTEIPGQQNEACSLAAECLILKQIGYKILYFLLFLVFCVTLYHYDLIVCFAMYLFSLYWLYCEGRRSKESVKKE